MLCSAVKHAGSGRALKKWGKTLEYVLCFPLLSIRALPLPACFTTEQTTVESVEVFFIREVITLTHLTRKDPLFVKKMPSIFEIYTPQRVTVAGYQDL